VVGGLVYLKLARELVNAVLKQANQPVSPINQKEFVITLHRCDWRSLARPTSHEQVHARDAPQTLFRQALIDRVHCYPLAAGL
jgi:hypothetical protein